MGIQAGKIAVIFDDDQRLADVWKGKPGQLKDVAGIDDEDGGGIGDPGESNRPQRSDIVSKGFETYRDDFNVERVKAKFRIYNSSKESIDGFSFALTLPDKQGGRA